MQISIANQGLNLNLKTWSKTLRNPFYAGIIKHGLLKELVKGNHPAVVSEDLYNQVQKILNGTLKGKHHVAPRYSMARLIRCDKCGKALSGYEVKKKGKHYYKCPTTGCGTNIAANKLNAEFLEFLLRISIDPGDITTLKMT